MQATDIRNKIAAGQIRQAIQDFLSLSESALAKGSEWRNELYVLKGRLEEINKQERQGTMEEAEIIRLKNQIAVAVMELADSWERGVTPGTPPSHTVPGTGPIQKSSRNWLLLIAVLIAVGAGSIIFNRSNQKNNLQVTRPKVEHTVPSTRPTPVRPPEVQFTGCYIETKMLTYLLHRPEVGATKIGTLPEYKKYQVTEVEKVNFGGLRTILFFKIQDNDLGSGWVQEGLHVNFISPDCL